MLQHSYKVQTVQFKAYRLQLLVDELSQLRWWCPGRKMQSENRADRAD